MTAQLFRDCVRSAGLNDAAWFAALDSHDEAPLLTVAEATELVAGVAASRWLSVLVGHAAALLAELGRSGLVDRWGTQDYLLALTLPVEESAGLADMIPNLFVSPPGALLADPPPFCWPKKELGRRVEQAFAEVVAIRGEAWAADLVVLEDIAPDGVEDAFPSRVYVAYVGSNYVQRALSTIRLNRSR